MNLWQQFINQTQSAKIAVFEIDIPGSISLWLNDSPGVWKYRYKNKCTTTTYNFQNGAFCYGSFENAGTGETGINAESRRISSLVVNGEDYSLMSSYGNCRKNIYSFYFDPSESILYVNFFDVLPWTTASIKAGITYGFATQAIYIDDIYYEPRLRSIPNISIRMDDLFYGTKKFSFGSVKLINEDGFFDAYGSLTLFGQACRAKLTGKLADGTLLGFNDMKTFYTGYVQTTDTTPREFTIGLGDRKDKIGRTLPVNFFSSATYPDIKSNNVGKGIPLPWGTCRNITCICVNEEDTPAPANYKFVVADIEQHSIKALDAVYIDGVAESPTPTLVYDTSDNVAYFNIASGGNYDPGKLVTADIKGFDDSAARDGSGTLIEDALDIIEDIFSSYLNISYNSDNFDTTEWGTEKNTDKNQGICISDNTSISDIINKIAVGHMGVFYLTGNNKWSFRTINDNRPLQLLIDIDEMFNEPNEFKDGTLYLTSATVKHSIDNNKKQYAEYTDNTGETTSFYNYGIRKNQIFETHISDATEAQDLASKAMTEFGTVKGEFQVITSIRAIDLLAFDNIVVVMNRKYKTWLGAIKCRVMGIEYNITNPMSIKLSLRYIENSTTDAIIDIIEIVKEHDNLLEIGKYASETNKINIVKWR